MKDIFYTGKKKEKSKNIKVYIINKLKLRPIELLLQL